MIHPESPALHAIYKDYIVLEWGWSDTIESLSDYTFCVLRATSEAGPWVKVSVDIPASDRPIFADTTLPYLTRPFKHLYRIRVWPTASPGAYADYGDTPWRKVLATGAPVGGITLEGTPSPMAQKMRESLSVYMRRSGEHVLHLSVRSTGRRCPDCWDALKRAVRDSRCRTCYATGYAGGYYAPLKIRLLPIGRQEGEHMTALGELKQGDAIRRAEARPRIFRRDLIITTSERFRVLSCDEAIVDGAPVGQLLQLRPIPRSDIEFEIQIDAEDWGRTTLSGAPMIPLLATTDIDSWSEAAARHRLPDEDLPA